MMLEELMSNKFKNKRNKSSSSDSNSYIVEWYR